MIEEDREEATETVMAAKDGDKLRITAEVADLWFHCLVLLARHGLGPDDVRAELTRREGTSGVAEKASRKPQSVARGAPVAWCRMHLRPIHAMGAKPAENERCRTACFCKIVRGEIPSKKALTRTMTLAFHDIRPQAPVHFMLIPKRHIGSLADVTMDDAGVLGRMMALAGRPRASRVRQTVSASSPTPAARAADVMRTSTSTSSAARPLGPMLPRSAS
jgi:hypothetical protein